MKLIKHAFIRKVLCLFLVGAGLAGQAFGQKTYYIDGFHGGVWGHYPDWNTQFMADQLKANPYWRINIEIEPETWDRAQTVTPSAYNDFKSLFADQSFNGRIEYTNPSYAQSYMYNIEGESIIRQFYYGMKKVKVHFPSAVFTTYAVEEPCFTSALPQILKSFGFKYASLKNPNTCFGGYTRAHGGELVNWIGPDGTGITAVPRYAVEALSPKSTWQTIAWNNGPEYIKAAFSYGIQHPIGMTYQDAGWKGGPFAGDGKQPKEQNIYTTWRNYFANIVADDSRPDWKLSQEDIQVSLVWGSQVMQNIARQVRQAENKILSAEKVAALANIYEGRRWPQQEFDDAWRALLLSQHHDCWIVPYNGKPNNTWADKVKQWTAHTDSISNSVIQQWVKPVNTSSADRQLYVRVYNTLGQERREVVTVRLPVNWKNKTVKVADMYGHEVTAQVLSHTASDSLFIAFQATSPALGYNTYHLKLQPAATSKQMISIAPDGKYHVETDLYTVILDPKQGGMIRSLLAKKLGNKEFVDRESAHGFNEMRGNFYEEGGFKSSKDNPAQIEILENGPLVARLLVKGQISQYPFTQTITLVRGQPHIDVDLSIDWKNNPRVGQPTLPGTYRLENYHKAFYNDRSKLLAMFPLKLDDQKVYKNAPFDVTESHLKNTFFSTWDSIKNNVLLNWVDVTDGKGQYGMALLTDHTTNYAHAEDFPLSLNVQYSGMGLWGRDHKITGATHLRYALIPHAGKWNQANLWSKSEAWNQPLLAGEVSPESTTGRNAAQSLLRINHAGVQVTALLKDGENLLVRFFNAESNETRHTIYLNAPFRKAALVELNGSVRQAVKLSDASYAQRTAVIDVPPFGIRTLRLSY
jgi:alpha-mannosidase